MVPVVGAVFSGGRIIRRFSRVGDEILQHGPVMTHGSPMSQFDEVAPPTSRAHHGNSGGGGGSSLVIGNTKYLPSDIKVSRSRVESWAKMMKDGTFPWDKIDEPIEVTIAPNGTFITDGHNRFLATKVAGLNFPEDLPPGAVDYVVESKPFPQPYQRDPWSGTWQWSNLRWEP
jgi:hypothetical protein